jgi:hypothetical protein
MSELRRITITFTAEGIEYGVTYLHTDEPPTPVYPAKARTSKAARMACKGLELALQRLSAGAAEWGGYGTDTRQSTDRILVAGGGA